MNNERPTPETDAETAHKQDAYEYINPPEWEWVVPSDFARKLERERDEALEALREAWFAMDELVDVPDRIINWQNKYAHTLEETK